MLAGVITNETKDPTLEYTALVCDFLEMRDVTCYTKNPPVDADFWVILGGDGTMLRYSHLAALYDIPLLGINLGTLGFLTDVEKQDGTEALAKVLSGDFILEKRMMLETLYICSSGSDESLLSQLLRKKPENRNALNDIFVGSSFGDLARFSVYVNDQLLDIVRANGIIVATPTGSTAYNLSAGGPLLLPHSDMMVITPVCPHDLSSRPVVVSASDVVRIVPHNASNLILDGETRGATCSEDSIVVQKSNYQATIIRTTPVQLNAVLRKKKVL